MKRNLIAIIALIALGGLTFVQFRLLVIGARLEKLRFDQQLLVAQRNIRAELDESNPISNALIEHLKNSDEIKTENEVLADSLHALIKNIMAKENIGAQFSYAITPRRDISEVNFTSNNFDAVNFDFHEYVVPLGDYFSSQIFREKTLHIDVENLFGYLLTELDYLIIPSILCLLAILICLWLLINILQKEQKLNTIKNDFINNLTHELKTPAFSISLSNKLAKENLKKGNIEKVTEFLQIIENENNKLKNHTEKVLELASLESPNHQIIKEKIDIHLLIKEVVVDFEKKLEITNGQIHQQLNAGNSILKIDKSHFKNVVFNLLDNAIKYGQENAKIEVYTKNEKKYFILKISDNGVGISTEDQKYIFDKFYRVSNNDIHKVKGFGLGLNYAKQVVESHNGKINVESKLGEGTTFLIQLPY